jgi:DNA modification methylase
MTYYQARLPIRPPSAGEIEESIDYSERLGALLDEDLDFHDQQSNYASHNLHSFPAKFPPQLPRKFIDALTSPGDVVLDPMAGSGTTLVEAVLAGRHGIAFDIDPLALLLSRVKVTPVSVHQAAQAGHQVFERAAVAVATADDELTETLESRWDSKTRRFVDYWFAPETQLELLALITEIGRVADPQVRALLELTFSSVIITKSGGVSLALDLGHTRPHRAKRVIDTQGQVVLEQTTEDISSSRARVLSKTLRPALEEFRRKLRSNLKGLVAVGLPEGQPLVACGDAQTVPLASDSVDLIVTSPPYASNAIDYMRAHKFSLVWMGHDIDTLGRKRGKYIGGEAIRGVDFQELPSPVAEVVAEITAEDEKKGLVLHRYYSEMTWTLREMLRVLKPGRAAILVVGTSTMRGRDTQTQRCLAEIGRAIGFEVTRIGVRNLDRDRRMMPSGAKVDLASQIQQRMHREYVIGFYKPSDQERRRAEGT